jgi:hypothetical protein
VVARRVPRPTSERRLVGAVSAARAAAGAFRIGKPQQQLAVLGARECGLGERSRTLREGELFALVGELLRVGAQRGRWLLAFGEAIANGLGKRPRQRRHEGWQPLRRTTARSGQQRGAGEQFAVLGPLQIARRPPGQSRIELREQRVAARRVARPLRLPRGREHDRQCRITAWSLRPQQLVKLPRGLGGIRAHELRDLRLPQPFGDHGIRRRPRILAQPADRRWDHHRAIGHREAVRNRHQLEHRRGPQGATQRLCEFVGACPRIEFGARVCLFGRLQQAPTNERDEARARAQREQADQRPGIARWGGDRFTLPAGGAELSSKCRGRSECGAEEQNR